MKKLTAALATLTAVIMTASVASAQETIDPVAETTSLAQDGLASVGPIILAVAGVVVTLAALRFGVRFVLNAVGSGGKRAS